MSDFLERIGSFSASSLFGGNIPSRVICIDFPPIFFTQSISFSNLTSVMNENPLVENNFTSLSILSIQQLGFIFSSYVCAISY